MALNKVWVFAEVDTPGKPTSMTLELLTTARAMAGTVECFYAGADPEGMAGPLGEDGATHQILEDIATAELEGKDFATVAATS